MRIKYKDKIKKEPIITNPCRNIYKNTHTIIQGVPPGFKQSDISRVNIYNQILFFFNGIPGQKQFS